MTRSTSLWIALVTLAAACQGQSDEAGEPAADTTALAPAPALEPALPDTTGEAVWTWLQEENYQETWSLWPGKDRLYAGTDPHGALLTTYVNFLAEDALNNGAASMPEGASVVKENYMPDSTLASVTVMVKVDGYNPDHQDWFFAKYGSEGTIDAAGRAEGCQSCHGQEPDYLFTGDLGSPATGGGN